MRCPVSLRAVALAAALCMAAAGAGAAEAMKYPDWVAQWKNASGGHFNSASHVLIGKENYYVSEDGYLLPVRKNQPPPDLRYFNPPQR